MALNTNKPVCNLDGIIFREIEMIDFTSISMLSRA